MTRPHIRNLQSSQSVQLMEVMEVVGEHVSYIARQLDQNVLTKLAAFLLGFVVQYALREGRMQ